MKWPFVKRDEYNELIQRFNTLIDLTDELVRDVAELQRLVDIPSTTLDQMREVLLLQQKQLNELTNKVYNGRVGH